MSLMGFETILGLSIVGMGTIPVVNPEFVDKVATNASINPFYGIWFLLVILFLGVLWFAYKQSIQVTELTKALNRLVTELNHRPCIKQAKNEINIEETYG